MNQALLLLGGLNSFEGTAGKFWAGWLPVLVAFSIWSLNGFSLIRHAWNRRSRSSSVSSRNGVIAKLNGYGMPKTTVRDTAPRIAAIVSKSIVLVAVLAIGLEIGYALGQHSTVQATKSQVQEKKLDCHSGPPCEAWTNEDNK